MKQGYDARDWYWIVAGDKTRVYHSARNAYVPVADQEFQDFLRVNDATRIASESELAEVLGRYGLPFLASKPAVSFGDPVKRAMFEVMFDHENRIRSLAGQAAVTRAQFLAAMRNLL